MKRTMPGQWKYARILLSMLAITFCSLDALAGNIDPDDAGCRYAWGENVGWINFGPSQGPGVTVTGLDVTGMAWGENIGWINFAPAYGGVVNDGMGMLSGYAWAENAGWINFHPAGGGVTIGADGKFAGYAWGENIGWINFSAANACVKTAWTPASDGTPDPFDFSPLTNVPLNTIVTSNAVLISGINTPAPVESITGGEYSINGGVFTSATDPTVFVSAGDSVRLRQTSSGAYSTTTAATITIGGVSGSFSVTTVAVNTDVISPGSGVVAVPNPQVTLTFDVVTSGGTVSAIPADPGGITAPPNFSLLGGAAFDITTDAGFTGQVQVCIHYDPAALVQPETSLRLFHSSNGSWTDITLLPVDTVGKRVCGLTDSLSLFAIAEPMYAFTGFIRPIENLPVVNNAKAGQVIPVKWRITYAEGTPVSDPASFKSFVSYEVACNGLEGDPVSSVEEYAAGNSGIQYSGDGYWQFNWKTPKTYADQCRKTVLTLGDGNMHEALFRFK